MVRRVPCGHLRALHCGGGSAALHTALHTAPHIAHHTALHTALHTG